MSADGAAGHAPGQAPDPAAERLAAVNDALHKVQEQAAALEDLAEHLSLSVHVLEAEVATLARELRSRPSAPARDDADAPPQPAQIGSTESLVVPPRSTDVDGARLVALNMALGGEPREATARYLAERFELADAGRMVDEVYAIVTG